MNQLTKLYMFPSKKQCQMPIDRDFAAITQKHHLLLFDYSKCKIYNIFQNIEHITIISNLPFSHSFFSFSPRSLTLFSAYILCISLSNTNAPHILFFMTQSFPSWSLHALTFLLVKTSEFRYKDKPHLISYKLHTI
jgi:hypothetical protein